MSAVPAKFDITDHLRNKVREVFVSSIPDENMDAMLQAEIMVAPYARPFQFRWRVCFRRSLRRRSRFG